MPLIDPITATPEPFEIPPDPPRTGIHLSTILKSILTIHNPKVYGRPITDHTRATFERGFALEDMLKVKRLWPQHLLLQQEFIEDNIIHTLDGFDARLDRVYESKCTLISARNEILSERFISWKWQLGCYIRVSKAKDAFLDVLFLCGDWSPPTTWPPKRWRMDYSKAAQDSIWSMVRRHRDQMVKKGLLK